MQVGSLVECVDNSGLNPDWYIEIPVLNKIYTIRETDSTGVLLEEIKNPSYNFLDGDSGEIGFLFKRFRELLPPMSINISEIMHEHA